LVVVFGWLNSTYVDADRRDDSFRGNQVSRTHGACQHRSFIGATRPLRRLLLLLLVVVVVVMMAAW